MQRSPTCILAGGSDERELVLAFSCHGPWNMRRKFQGQEVSGSKDVMMGVQPPTLPREGSPWQHVLVSAKFIDSLLLVASYSF